jgi:hypothetical protein
MGSLKRKDPLRNFGPHGVTIQLLEDDKYGKIVGVPFWKSGSEEPPSGEGFSATAK